MLNLFVKQSHKFGINQIYKYIHYETVLTLFFNAFAKVLSLIFNVLIQSYLQENSFIKLFCKSNCPNPFLYNKGIPCFISKIYKKL